MADRMEDQPPMECGITVPLIYSIQYCNQPASATAELSNPPRRHPFALSDARLASLGRAPLERAFSVPENAAPPAVVTGSATDLSGTRGRRSSGLRSSTVPQETPEIRDPVSTRSKKLKQQRNSMDSVRHGSGSSINISRKSYERLTGIEPNFMEVPQVRVYRPPDSAGTEYLTPIVMGENNIPEIDVAITPPDDQSPDVFGNGGKKCGYLSQKSGMQFHGTANFNHNRHHSRFMGVSSPGTAYHRQRRGSSRDDLDRDVFLSNPTVHCPPTLTITRDLDDASLISDYISPTPYFRYKDPLKFPSLGDDISLYGTPKEDMSPFKDADTASRQSPSNYLKDQIISFFQPSDNKLAMKLFGNKNALMKEKMRQKAAGNWVIHPCSNFRQRFYLFIYF